jgi:Ca-activated chloride channel family protein
MSPTRFSRIRLACAALLALSAAACAAQQDASMAYSRAAINRGAIVPAESVRVHEYLNYYEQRFPESSSEPIGLDLRLGSTQIPAAGGEIWLQIGLQARQAEGAIRTPLNLALVLDVSGSMDSPDKMPYLQQSLMVFLASLHPEDRVAVVTYSDQADLLWPSQIVGSGDWIRSTVESLRPGGSTNLHAGLMLGLQEVERNFDIRRNNRVILLTDGIANVGETDPEQIARQALAYNQHGIYLSTVGLGLDFNDDLLSTLARQGQGAYHFVDSAMEMDKVFRQEVEGLVERVAEEVRVAIQPEPGVRLMSVTGYQGTPPADGVQVVLQEMGAGDSQVLIVRLEALPGQVGRRPLAVVTLSYLDVFAQRSREVAQPVTIQVSEISFYDPLADVEIRRNATVVRSAEALIAIDGLFNQARYLEAWQLAYQMERELRAVAAISGDQQMVEEADLFARYQVTLAAALGYPPQPTTFPAEGDQPQRWGAPLVPVLPTVELDG